jgi:hypothetical protein
VLNSAVSKSKIVRTPAVMVWSAAPVERIARAKLVHVPDPAPFDTYDWLAEAVEMFFGSWMKGSVKEL